jgi:hypothetical protein
MRFCRVFPIDLIEAATGGKKMEAVVEHKEWLGQGEDDRQGKPFCLHLITELTHGDVSSDGAAPVVSAN